MDLWILETDGRESSIRIKKDIPLKEGHRVTVVNACLDGREEYPCLRAAGIGFVGEGGQERRGVASVVAWRREGRRTVRRGGQTRRARGGGEGQ